MMHTCPHSDVLNDAAKHCCTSCRLRTRMIRHISSDASMWYCAKPTHLLPTIVSALQHGPGGRCSLIGWSWHVCAGMCWREHTFRHFRCTLCQSKQRAPCCQSTLVRFHITLYHMVGFKSLLRCCCPAGGFAHCCRGNLQATVMLMDQLKPKPA
jgi:hypothetical protein